MKCEDWCNWPAVFFWKGSIVKCLPFINHNYFPDSWITYQLVRIFQCMVPLLLIEVPKWSPSASVI